MVTTLFTDETRVIPDLSEAGVAMLIWAQLACQPRVRGSSDSTPPVGLSGVFYQRFFQSFRTIFMSGNPRCVQSIQCFINAAPTSLMTRDISQVWLNVSPTLGQPWVSAGPAYCVCQEPPYGVTHVCSHKPVITAAHNALSNLITWTRRQTYLISLAHIK